MLCCLSNDYSPEVTWSVCRCNWSRRQLEKFAKMRHIGDVRGSWISHQKKSVHSTPTDALRVGKICLEISSALVFYSPDDWSRREKKVKEQDIRRWTDVGRPAYNGGKGGEPFGRAT